MFITGHTTAHYSGRRHGHNILDIRTIVYYNAQHYDSTELMRDSTLDFL